MFVCLFIYLFIYLYIYLYIYSPIYLFIYSVEKHRLDLTLTTEDLQSFLNRCVRSCTYLTLPYILQYSFVFTLYLPTFPFQFNLPVLLSFLLFQYKMMYSSFSFSYTCPLILIFNSLCTTPKRIFGRVNKHQHSTHSRCTSTYLLVKKHI